MRKIPKLLLTILVLMISFSAHTQRRENSGDNKINEAMKLAKKAKKLWNDEQYSEAEKLYYQANQLSPNIYYLQELANFKMAIGDIKGANKVWDDCIKTLSGNEPFTSSKKEVHENLMSAYSGKINANIKKGHSMVALKTLINVISTYMQSDEKILGKQSEFWMPVYDLSEVVFQSGDINSLDTLYKLLKINNNSDDLIFRAEMFLKILQGKYNDALSIALEVEDKGGGFLMSRVQARNVLAIIYSFKGDVENSEKYMKEAKKNVFIGNEFFAAIDGRNALTQKKYKEAIDFFSEAIRPKKVMFSSIDKPGKFVNYTKRAEAYEGLGDFMNAKKDYEAALVYESDYEPALVGLARLDGRVISERRKDKTPPVIIITEPTAISGGVNIGVVGNDVMIKGIAKDSFGIKSVTLNGTAAFVKEEGDFWANVSLTSGLNAITIEATDMAGNTASKTFQIEQQVAPVATNEIIPVAKKESRNFALFIASQNYDDASIPSLENPIPDAVRLKLILKNNYGFKDENIISLFNPERSNFRQQFQYLTEVLQPEDNLIVFYAGHGIWVEKEKKGYWMLTDARLDDVNTWLANKEVLDLIAKLPTRHTLLITDACFSGGVFKTRGIGIKKKEDDTPLAIQKLNEKITRVAITSGNDTEVPDESVFMKYLIKALTENKDKYLTAQKMFINQILEAVMTETGTEPRYGTLEMAGHAGGDFIFIKK